MVTPNLIQNGRPTPAEFTRQFGDADNRASDSVQNPFGACVNPPLIDPQSCRHGEHDQRGIEFPSHAGGRIKEWESHVGQDAAAHAVRNQFIRQVRQFLFDSLDLQPLRFTMTDTAQDVRIPQMFLNTQQIKLGSKPLRHRNRVLHLTPTWQREVYRSQNPTNWYRILVCGLVLTSCRECFRNAERRARRRSQNSLNIASQKERHHSCATLRNHTEPVDFKRDRQLAHFACGIRTRRLCQMNLSVAFGESPDKAEALRCCILRSNNCQPALPDFGRFDSCLHPRGPDAVRHYSKRSSSIGGFDVGWQNHVCLQLQAT